VSAVRIHYSHFGSAEIRVPHGVPVTFVVDNTDPIDHEFIVGDKGVQDRHERGTERRHGARPTEIGIGPLTSVSTTITFARAGVLTYACHLPGHFLFGMHGRLVVT
jgi:uncharacterized cupredoxin-like copper-binding protein